MPQRNDAVHLFQQHSEGQGGVKACALLKGAPQGQAEEQHGLKRQAAQHRVPAAALQRLVAEDIIIEAVQEKVEKIGHDGFAAFRLDDIHGGVVGVGMELEQNFSHQADARLARDAAQRKGVKFTHHAGDVAVTADETAFGHIADSDFGPQVSAPLRVRIHRAVPGTACA